MPEPLPIEAVLPEITTRIREGHNLVIEAPPGAGKTTRVPAALLELFTGPTANRGLFPGMGTGSVLSSGQVVVLEPRRLAARMAARRVAEERNERLGETVGFQVRFEVVGNRQTRLWFVTEGVLTRRLIDDPELKEVQVVVLDEFHERHLQTDMALMLLRRLQKTTRPDLKIVAMSATLETTAVAAFLGDCPVVRSEGKRFEVELEHSSGLDSRPLEQQVAGGLRKMLATPSLQKSGDILVFLPGAAEIRRAREACQSVAETAQAVLLPLHGDLTPEEQDRAVRPAAQRKIILSTNVAESSVTIEGVAGVLDSGLARIMTNSPWTGLPRLDVGKISRSAAIQRSGRAGRTRPGICLRLYTKHDFETRPAFETNELSRVDLAETVLTLHGLGIRQLDQTEWLEAPPADALAAADQLLLRLGAIDSRMSLTETGRQMLRFPLHPRLSRLVLETQRLGWGQEGCLAAAILGERDIRLGARSQLGGSFASPKRNHLTADSDILVLLDAFAEAKQVRFEPNRLRGFGLDVGAVTRTERSRRQIQRILSSPGKPVVGQVSPVELEEAIARGLLTAFPDRVARRRSKGKQSGTREVLLSGGGAAELSENSAVHKAEFLVCTDVEERPGKAVLVRLASKIEPEWLLEYFPEFIREEDDVQWDAQSERVTAVSRMCYDQLVIDESRGGEGSQKAAAQVLFEVIQQRGIRSFVNAEKLDGFLARLEFLRRALPEKNYPLITETELAEATRQLCLGRSGVADFRRAAEDGNTGLLARLKMLLSASQLGEMERLAPEFTSLSARRHVRIHYEIGQSPWLESRLQDFFGMERGPSVAGGRVPVVLHLLAPNQRAVQVTTDLAGFWERHYPGIRKELCRRYPKHSWPENPRRQN
ncbi:MAG: ATP-dependent helicase HrpB [Blastocatellia bacterium]|nr:ATP-dependent helicase HrpB [Blastocatellia bacterium]